MTPPGVLFDLDGTLLELDVDIEAVRLGLAALFAPFGVTGPFRPILARIDAASEEAGRKGGDASALRRQARGLLDEAELVGARVARARPDALAAVRALAAARLPLAIVTDNGRAAVPVALAAAGYELGAFVAIVTRDEVAQPKPDPAGVRAAADAIRAAGATPAWLVGDHAKDVESARAAAIAGLRVYAVPGGLGRTDALTAAGADVVGPMSGLVASVLP